MGAGDYPPAMLASVRWLNDLLEGADLSEAEIEAALTRAGFPIEGREALADGDVRLDVEITSNRGDCLCHAGLAREIAAQTARRLALPAVPALALSGKGLTRDNSGQLVEAPPGEFASDATAVDNQALEACPRFTARVICGASVGPSPAWLAQRLEAAGQRPINNIVDASNFVLRELGQPTHTFDLNTLAQRRLVVRFAHEGEKLTTLEGESRTLKADELVVADAERAQSLAGVVGGLPTAVSARTTDILLEAATWDPATIRRAARRHQIATDASHRFERVVDPATIDFAAARLAALIVEIAGGTLLPGVIDAGVARGAERRTVALRPARCAQLLGVDMDAKEIARCLESLEIRVLGEEGGALACEIPRHRPDLSREVDLIEEAARAHGYDSVPICGAMRVAPPPIQVEEQALRLIGETLAGLGFFEAVTFSFVTREEAQRFMPPGMAMVCVDEARRPGAPALRPSVIPSLLACRKVNQDAGAAVESGLGLFEIAAVYAQSQDGRETYERRALALLLDAPNAQRGVRELRGAIEALAHRLGGPATRVDVEPAAAIAPAFSSGGFAGLTLNGERAGYLSLLDAQALRAFDLDAPVVAAEVSLESLLGLFPPDVVASAPPAFPASERDLSIVIAEETPWSAVARAVEGASLAWLESSAFVGVYRGEQAGAGRKSVTLRLRFRSRERTLRSEDVDAQVGKAVAALRERVGAALRGT